MKNTVLRKELIQAKNVTVTSPTLPTLLIFQQLWKEKNQPNKKKLKIENLKVLACQLWKKQPELYL